MYRPSRDLGDGLSDSQVSRSEHGHQLRTPYPFNPAPGITPCYQNPRDFQPQTFSPTVEPSASPAYETGPGSSGPLGGPYSAFHGPGLIHPVRSSTLANSPWSGVSSDGLGPTSIYRAMTLPGPRDATHFMYSPTIMSAPPRCGLAQVVSSQAFTYEADQWLPPPDGPPLLGSDESASLPAVIGEILKVVPSDVLDVSPPPGHPFVNDTVQPSQDPSAEMQVLSESHAQSSSSKRVIQRKAKSRSRKPTLIVGFRELPSTSPRFRAQLSEGASVSYGDGCRFDHVMLPGNTHLPADYDAVALLGQTFGQKVSFWFKSEGYKYTRQLNILLRGGQPTKRRLAQVAFSFMEYVVKDCEDRDLPRPCSLEHLVLRRIDVTSRSAVRPIFDSVVPAG